MCLTALASISRYRTPARVVRTRIGLGELWLCGQDRHEAVSGNIPSLELGGYRLGDKNVVVILAWPCTLRAHA